MLTLRPQITQKIKARIKLLNYKRRYRIFNKFIIICLFVGSNLLASTVGNFKTICNMENKLTKEFINNECLIYFGTYGIYGPAFYNIESESMNYSIDIDINKNIITLDNIIVDFKADNNIYIYMKMKNLNSCIIIMVNQMKNILKFMIIKINFMIFHLMQME